MKTIISYKYKYIKSISSAKRICKMQINQFPISSKKFGNLNSSYNQKMPTSLVNTGMIGKNKEKAGGNKTPCFW